ncbi:AFR246Cp [Eremothecium gossypii ATCC 10895]|uniref:AFR246Cp n=1 Tax=Eremothecium gossypii (strain ATCC 10895 / CBS 109.51 / FGSC 9923 / NRRL Y-1056) TaxID=284811 RepID=Q753T0_EREGS|nr:AFR246Cp [Eremothecium gossypii ATCC 10895]AAS53617.1 AFR246Cp [Eremothecium gossypii ATCC 10895]AEY97930.1 FAFR246Cp [Eremothecium gossypii FDAG1]
MLARFVWLIAAGLLAIVNGFTADEAEIFNLQKVLTDKYGKDMNLYRFLKLEKLEKSDGREITRQMRALAKKYHPDKNPKYKKLYERLHLAAQILTDGEKRKTYDYYLDYGFPEYRVDKRGFVFQRVQPKTWVVLAFVLVATSAIHWTVLKLQHRSRVRRVEGFLREVKEQDDTLGLGEKRLQLQLGDSDPQEVVVRFGDVFVVQENNTETRICAEELRAPGLLDTLMFALPMWAVGRVRAPFRKQTEPEAPVRTEPAAVKKKSPKPKGKGQKWQLPNGKVLYSRAKKD